MNIQINLKSIILVMAALFALGGCSDEMAEGGKMDEKFDGEAIQLTAEIPPFDTFGLTRAPEESIKIPEKTEFQAGEAIHVSAVFTVQDPDKTTKDITLYDCFVYRNNRWTSTFSSNSETLGKVMKWPWNATKGKFKAYYIPGSTGAIDESVSCTLGGTYDTCDVLYAETEELEFGHSVNLTFNHLCTRLVLTDVKTGYVDRFGLRNKTLQTGTPDVVNDYKQMNTCTLTRNEDNTLNFSFEQQPDAYKETMVMSMVSTIDNKRVLMFYLQPGNYYGTEICYASGQTYLHLNINDLNAGGKKEKLEAGHSYQIDVSHTPGVIEEEENNPWENPSKEEPIWVIDIDKFLESIEKGRPYKQQAIDSPDSVQITQKDPAGHLELLHNLDFSDKNGNGRQFNPRNLPASGHLHGGFHYIKNIVNTLFVEVRGTIDNIELRDVNIDGKNIADGLPRIGALARRLYGNARNIRLNECTIKARAPQPSTVVRPVGALVGEQFDGLIEEVALMGNISVEVTNMENTPVCSATTNIGGIVGQTAGTVRKITMQPTAEGNAPTLTITNTVSGGGIVSTGGVAGVSSGIIEDCTLTCTIDAPDSKAQQNCVGGLVGRLRGGYMNDCTVSGTIIGGTTQWPGNNLDGYALTGGICGYFVDAPIVSNCHSYATVANNTEIQTTRTVYATGGGFGRITPNGNDVTQNINGCRVIGTVSSTIGTFGWFAGQALGITEEQLEANNNQANGNPFLGGDGRKN